MSKFVKWLMIGLGILGIALYSMFLLFKAETKKASPEETVHFKDAGLSIEVFYNRPYKKGRVIFDGLVPFGEVWRTGANEATTFQTNMDLIIQGDTLSAGKYTLWTIPAANEWQIIFNSKMYSWGVEWGGKSPRNPEHDAVVASVKPQEKSEVTEQFTIEVGAQNSEYKMDLFWDQTLVSMPFSVAK